MFFFILVILILFQLIFRFYFSFLYSIISIYTNNFEYFLLTITTLDKVNQ